MFAIKTSYSYNIAEYVRYPVSGVSPAIGKMNFTYLLNNNRLKVLKLEDLKSCVVVYIFDS